MDKSRLQETLGIPLRLVGKNPEKWVWIRKNHCQIQEISYTYLSYSLPVPHCQLLLNYLFLFGIFFFPCT